MASKITWTRNASGVTVGTVGELQMALIGKPKPPFDSPDQVRLYIQFPSSHSHPDGRCLDTVDAAKGLAEEALTEFYRKLRKAMEPAKKKATSS